MTNENYKNLKATLQRLIPKIIISHELTLSGAPVIVLEMASLLRERGLPVNVISQVNGPLRSAFEERNIVVKCMDEAPDPRLEHWLRPLDRRRRLYERLLRSKLLRERRTLSRLYSE